LNKEIEITNEFAVDDIPVKQHVLKKAQDGDGSAICRIGRIYYDRKEYTKAIGWFRLGVVKGLANAQFLVGLMYHQGEGVSVDYKLAMKWYIRAHNNGCIVAANNIGYLYGNGQGVAKDYGLALKWFLEGAKKADSFCQYGACYLEPSSKPLNFLEF
jgi:TPR repeat protein